MAAVVGSIGAVLGSCKELSSTPISYFSLTIEGSMTCRSASLELADMFQTIAGTNLVGHVGNIYSAQLPPQQVRLTAVQLSMKSTSNKTHESHYTEARMDLPV
jgi:hypothetical protein